MTDDPSFKMSQDYELVPPQKKRAYPILIEEWIHLKNKISGIRDSANFYHTIGSGLIGVSGSAFVAALNIPVPAGAETPMSLVISWAICIGAAVCGALALFFGHAQRQTQNSNANDVIEQMELIEKRYEQEET